MTIVAINIDRTSANCLADTKISASSKTSSEITSLAGKILAFGYVSRHSIKKPRRKIKSVVSEALFSYAGSTLVANTVFAIGSNFARNLYKNDRPTRAALSDVAEVFKYVFEQVMLDINSKQPIGQNLDCEFAITGFCPVARQPRAFHIKSDFANEVWASEMIEVSNPGWLLLGERSGFFKHFKRHQSKSTTPNFLPSLNEVLNDVIQDPEIPGVGGQLQWATCSKDGISFEPLVKRKKEEGAFFFQFCGVNLDSFEPTNRGFRVGDYGQGTLHKGL